MFEEYRDLLSVEEMCEMLCIGKNSAYSLLSSGKVPCFRQNRIWKIPKEGLIQYVRSQSNL